MSRGCHRHPRLFCAAERSALPGGGVVLCGVIRLCGVGRSALRGGFSLAFCGRLRCVRSRPVGGAVQGRGVGFAARLPPVAGADGRCGRQDGFRVRCLLSCDASCLLLPASCLLLPASCFPPPASCLPPSAVETGRTVKNSGKHPEKGCFPFGCRSELGGWPDGWWYGGFFRLSGASEVPAAPARLALRGSPFAAHLSRFALHGWPPHGCPLLFTFHLSLFTFHFSLSANPCEMKVRIGSRPVRQ